MIFEIQNTQAIFNFTAFLEEVVSMGECSSVQQTSKSQRKFRTALEESRLEMPSRRSLFEKGTAQRSHQRLATVVSKSQRLGIL